MSKKISIFLWAFLPVLLCACSNQDGPLRPVRSDYIKVYETSENKTVDAIQIPLDGVQDGQIHIDSNLDLQWKRLVDPKATDTDWFVIKSVEETGAGHIVITYDAASLLALNSLEWRSTKLSFSNANASLGKFMTVGQGYDRNFIEEDQTISLTGEETFTTKPYPVLNADYFDYIAFNAWAVTDNEFRSKNITLDITISGGLFYETNLTTYRVNVPIGTGPDKSNFKYLLIVGDGERLSNTTHFTFSVANDDFVYVYLTNFSAYKVTEADMNYLYSEDDFDWTEDEDGADWI